MNVEGLYKSGEFCRTGQDVPVSCDVPHYLDVEFEGTFCYNIKVWIRIATGV